MTVRPIRAAVVGCGRIARTHCSYLRGIAGVSVVAACDPIENVVSGLAGEFGIPGRFTDIGRMLAEVKPDAVHVLTPPSTHARVAIAAMEGGAHVLVEKPMAIAANEADTMAAAARRTGRTLCVDHNRWFDPVVQRAAGLVSSGGLGDLVGVEVFQGATAAEGAGGAPAGFNWRQELPGGALHDLAPHPVYLLRNFLGPIQELQVSSILRDGRPEEIRAVARGESALGCMTISTRTQPFTNSVRLLGSRLTAEVNLNNMTLIVRRERRVPKLVGKVLPNLDEATQLVVATVRNTIAYVTGRQRNFPGMGILIERFYAHLDTGAPPPTTPEEGVDVVRLLDLLWEQAGDAVPHRASA